MKKTILLGAITVLFCVLTFFPGCGCGQEEQVKEEEKPGNVLVPDFKGPDTPPFSNGPSEPPPSL